MTKLWLLAALFLGICSFTGCQETERGRINTLSMDSIFAVIASTFPALADSCIPSCWPRIFAVGQAEKTYTLYVIRSALGNGRGSLWNESFMRAIVDSTSYPLLVQLSANALKTATLSATGTVMIDDHLRMEFIDKPGDAPLDSETDLGYLRVSAVVIDVEKGRGMYLVEQHATGFFELLVQIERVDGQWRLIRSDVMALS